MTTVNYPSPVQVNGYTCRNCTDVDYAKKNIDPAHPTDGPFGVNKAQDAAKAAKPPDRPPAVVFGGQLAGVVQADNTNQDTSRQPASRVDLRI